jgi:predicted nicotinamide N-methyase
VSFVVNSSLSAHPESLAGFSSQQVTLDVEGHLLRLWRATEIERFVDADALLRDEAAAEPPYWMHLWPGALAAARTIARAAEIGAGTRVLELGCGLALPALVAARRGATVMASDRERAPLEFARRSAAANGCTLAVVQMDWSAPALRGRFDVCVGADIGYDAGAESGLVAGLHQMIAPGGVLWLADSVNTARGSLAERLAAADFAVEVASVREWEDGHAVWVRMITARRAA